MTGPAAHTAASPAAGRLAPVTLRAAAWTLLAVRRARRSLRADGLQAARIEPPRALPWAARRGVLGVLRRLDPTCLERAVVLQSWLASQSRRYDIVVGVRAEGGEVKAHAWLDFEVAPPDAQGYRELYRIAPP